MSISKVLKTDENLLNKCVEVCNKNHFDNLILLGDLNEPCIKLSDIFAIIEKEGKVDAVFTIFYGFLYPSIVIDFNCPKNNTKIIFDFIKKEVTTPFALINFNLQVELIKTHFRIIDISKEIYMKVDKKRYNFNSKKINGICIKQATPNNYEKIKKYYGEIQAYPWNPIQLESNFYHYIEINNKIIACGGTHFETPVLAHLGNIYVNPEFRRQYYGENLISTIVKRISNEKQHATLFVQRDNSAAINLYKKLGFRVYKNVELYICENM